MKYVVAVFGFLFAFFTTDTSGAAPTSEGDGKNTAAPTGEQPAGSPSGDGKDAKFTQADLDRVVQARLAEEATRTAKKTEAERKKADEEALAKNAEWQKLAETRAAELEALKPSAELAGRLITRMNAQAETEIAAWPDEIKALDPGAGNLDARLDWMEKARPLVAKLSTTSKPPTTQAGAGTGAGSTTSGSSKPPEAPKQPYRFQTPGDVSW